MCLGCPGACIGLSYNPVIALDLPDESLRPMVNTLFIQEMAKRGVHCNMSFKATLAHTEQDIEQTAQVASEALSVIKTGLDNADLTHLLHSDIKKEPFRRLVK